VASARSLNLSDQQPSQPPLDLSNNAPVNESGYDFRNGKAKWILRNGRTDTFYE
jgi:hypothetical protein